MSDEMRTARFAGLLAVVAIGLAFALFFLAEWRMDNIQSQIDQRPCSTSVGALPGKAEQ